MAYLIRVTCHFHVGAANRNARTHYFGKHGIGPTAPIVPFDTREAARAAIAAFDREPYVLSPGEHSRPTAAVIKAGAAPKWLDIHVAGPAPGADE